MTTAATFHHKVTDIRINAAPLSPKQRSTDGERVYAFHRNCRKYTRSTNTLTRNIKPKTFSAQSSTSSMSSTSSVESGKNIMRRRYNLKALPAGETIVRMNNRFRLSNTETLRATAHLHTRAWR